MRPDLVVVAGYLAPWSGVYRLDDEIPVWYFLEAGSRLPGANRPGKRFLFLG